MKCLPQKILLMTLSFSAFVSCSSKTEPGIEYMPDMVYSRAVEAYSESTLTKNGGSMLYAPKGSIPRGYKPFLYGDSDAEKERAGVELKDPRESSPARIERGKYLYTNACFVCHGKSGQGDGPVAKKYAEPPAFNGRALRDYKDGQFYHAIVRGMGDMPSHEAQLDDSDRWDVILYIHELQKIE
ncbi:MAG: cytochrome c [Bacteriovorax sp.]|jgi:mono/diheme cytochrome c family protein|nr:cytochrome c [Bacteriovorax sp.]